MNLTEVKKGNIKECCIACLSKSNNMLNLMENTEKIELFTNLFNVELNTFKYFPNCLCSTCDEKLNIINDFYKKVKESLLTLEEYNKKFDLVDSDEGLVKEELYEQDINLSDIKREREQFEDKVYNKDNSKIKIIDPNEVEKVIEEFRNRFSESKTCVICGFIAANRRSISSHMAIFHKDVKNNWCLECNNIYENYEEHKEIHSSRCKCPFCTKEVTVPHYIEHLRSHSGSFECKECRKTFKSAAWLTKHSRIHTNEKPYICPNCCRGFIQLSSLRYHLSTHGKYSCDSCKKHYRNAKDLEGHECSFNSKVLVTKEIWINPEGNDVIETEPAETIIIKGVEVVASSELQNFCKDCNKRVKSLKQHVIKYHNLPKEQKITKKIKCEFCEKAFSNAYKLKIHTRIHTGHLPYKCKFCDRRALTRSRLKDHERTHTKEKPYICNICGKCLSQSSALRTHMRQHTGRPETCHLCGKSFCRKSELKLHLSKHMGEKPFLCTECGRTFAQRSHLSEHMASHSEERPYGCSFCDKRFKTNNLLKEHLKLHQGFKPFKCPTCSYACYKAYRLQQHMKQHSNDSYEINEPLKTVSEDASHLANVDNDAQLCAPNEYVQTSAT